MGGEEAPDKLAAIRQRIAKPLKTNTEYITKSK